MPTSSAKGPASPRHDAGSAHAAGERSLQAVRGADLLMYRACADVLSLAARVPTSPSLPSPTELRQQLIAALDKMLSRGRRAELPDADLAEARYALVALLDEQVLRAPWSGRAEWMTRPLQFDLYQDNNAGEDFFVRFAALLRSGDRPLALQVYYLCLALGFEGMYAGDGERRTRERFLHAAWQQLACFLPPTDRLSPHGLPARGGRASSRARRPWPWLLSGAALLAVAIVMPAWSVQRALRAAVSELSEQQPVQLSTSPVR